MEEKVYPMTLEGKAKLEAELEDLKVNKRKEIIERIKIARSYGDLSENSEYDAAKDEQAFVEGRISVIEKMIRFAQIIDDRDVADDVVTLGRTVRFSELPGSDEESYTIVGSAEADPLEAKISNDSPIAKAIIGKKLGDVVTVETPGGSFDLKITKIEKN